MVDRTDSAPHEDLRWWLRLLAQAGLVVVAVGFMVVCSVGLITLLLQASDDFSSSWWAIRRAFLRIGSIVVALAAVIAVTRLREDAGRARLPIGIAAIGVLTLIALDMVWLRPPRQDDYIAPLWGTILSLILLALAGALAMWLDGASAEGPDRGAARPSSPVQPSEGSPSRDGRSGRVFWTLFGLVLGTILSAAGPLFVFVTLWGESVDDEPASSLASKLGGLTLWMLPGLTVLGFVAWRRTGPLPALLIVAGIWMTVAAFFFDLFVGSALFTFGVGLIAAAAVIHSKRATSGTTPTKEEG